VPHIHALALKSGGRLVVETCRMILSGIDERLANQIAASQLA